MRRYTTIGCLLASLLTLRIALLPPMSNAMKECLLLTEAEKIALETQGYTIHSGPHDTLEECESVCQETGTGTASTGTGTGTGEPPVSVACNTDPINRTLYVTLTDVAVTTFPIIYAGGEWTGGGTWGACNLHVTMRMYCDGVTIKYDIKFPDNPLCSGAEINGGVPTIVSSTPFHATNVEGFVGCDCIAGGALFVDIVE